MASKDPISGNLQGITTRDHRWEFERLRAKGANPYDSSYTQAGARTGIPEAAQDSDLTLRASGSQSEDGNLEILTRRAGHPAPDGGGFVVRDIAFGDAATEYLGHDGYQVMTGWDGSIRYDTSGSGATHAAPVIRLLSGDLLMVEFRSIVPHEVWRLDVKTGTWANVNTMVPDLGTYSGFPDPALLQLPSGRILYFYTGHTGYQVHVWFSDDDGDNWAEYASSVLDNASAGVIDAVSVAFTRGTVCMLIVYGGVPSTAQQWVSHDLGTTFQKVGADWYATAATPERPAHVNLIGLPSGQVSMIYWSEGAAGPSGSEVYTSRVIDPNQPGYLTDRNDLDIWATVPVFAQSTCASWADEDGVLYALFEHGTTSDRTICMRSTDGGVTWDDYKSMTGYFWSSSNNHRPIRYRVASSGGRASMVTRWLSDEASSEQSLGVISLGGHASSTVGTLNDNSEEYDGLSFLGWGGGDFAGTWAAIGDPTNMGWTNVGAGLGAMISGSKWRLSTSAATDYYRHADASNDDTTEVCNAVFQFTVNSGGSLAAPVVGVGVRISNYDQPTVTNATAINEVSLHFTTTGFRVYDAIAGAAVGDDVSYDMTLPTWIFIAMRAAAGGQGEAHVWYGRPGGPARRLKAALTSGQAGSFADDSGANPQDTNLVRWGNMSTGTAQSDWEFVGFNYEAHAFQPNQATNIVSGWSNPKHLRPRDFPTLPALVLDGVKVRAVDGPTRLNEKWTIKARYDYGIENLHTEISPSPRVPWRSTGDGQVELIVWDLEPLFLDDAFLGNYVATFNFFGCNFKTANVLGWNTGSGSWDTLAAIDASTGYGPLQYRRRGSTLTVNGAQTTSGEQYLWHNQHAGDTFDMGAGETGRYNRIKTNTEGAWFSDGAGGEDCKRPTVFLEPDNLAGGMETENIGSIWVRDFSVVLREYAGGYQRFALQIPSQKTVDGYYQIGAFLPGHTLVFGQRHDRGWVHTRQPNTSLATRNDGTRRSRVLGPVRRSVEFTWVNTALDVTQEQTASPSPDFISSGATDYPVASAGDVLRAVEGLVENHDGPARPIVFHTSFPQRDAGESSEHMITDRRLFMLGRIEGPTRVENVLGDEGVNELERLNKIVITEEV